MEKERGQPMRVDLEIYDKVNKDKDESPILRNKQKQFSGNIFMVIPKDFNIML